MRSKKITNAGRDAAACRVAPRVALCALLLWATSAVPAQAHPVARLAGGVDVSCDGNSAEYRVEVSNADTHPVTLTHALFFFQTHVQGERFWRPATVTNLLEEGEKGGVDPALAPGEQKAQVAMVDLVPTENVAHVRGILIVHVLGEPFWRIAVDVDACR